MRDLQHDRLQHFHNSAQNIKRMPHSPRTALQAAVVHSMLATVEGVSSGWSREITQSIVRELK